MSRYSRQQIILGLGILAVIILAASVLPFGRWFRQARNSLPSNSLLSSANDTGNFAATSVVFSCSDGQQYTVQYLSPEEVQLTLPNNQTYSLRAEQPADGFVVDNNVLYTDGDYGFYTQGGMGFVERDSSYVPGLTSCQPQSALPSPSPGATPTPSPSINPTPSVSPTPAPPPISGAIRYTCRNGSSFQVVFSGEQATLYLPNSQPLYLSQVPTEPGSAYSDGSTILYTRDNQAQIDRDGFPVYQDCIQAGQGGGERPSPRPQPPNALW